MTPSIPDLFVQRNTTVTSGDVSEGCAEGHIRSGLAAFRRSSQQRWYGRSLPRRSAMSGLFHQPVGDCGNPNFVCSPAQGHNHPTTITTRVTNCWTPPARPWSSATNRVSASSTASAHIRNTVVAFQGISAGCADIYYSSLGCQYLDITGVPNGNYQLRVTVDPFGRFAELDESNNVAQRAITLTGGGGGGRRPHHLRRNSCDTPTVVPAAGGSFSGTTSGTSTQSGTCGSTGVSPEKVYQWTPAASGPRPSRPAVRHGFDSVLYMRNGTCTWSQLSCNDDTPVLHQWRSRNRGSRLTPTVTAGQTYFTLVDGYNGAAGAYNVTITPPSSTSPPPPPPHHRHRLHRRRLHRRRRPSGILRQSDSHTGCRRRLHRNDERAEYSKRYLRQQRGCLPTRCSSGRRRRPARLPFRRAVPATHTTRCCTCAAAPARELSSRATMTRADVQPEVGDHGSRLLPLLPRVKRTSSLLTDITEAVAISL